MNVMRAVDDGVRSRPHRSAHVLDVIVLLGVLALGAARLPTPLGGDQAQNLLMGQLIAEGGALYRDLWDLKHPGVFFFNAAAGATFGFNEVGIHAFELIWMLVLAVVTRLLAARWLVTPAATSLAPALTVGSYYAVAGERYLTQTECLVGLPLLASLWCSVEASRPGRRLGPWLAASGFCAGVAAVFKFPLVIIPVLVWILTILSAKASGNLTPRRLAAAASWMMVGLVLPLGAAAQYLITKDVVDIAAWTYFQHPGEAWQVADFDPLRLARSARSFAVAFAPILALACAAVAVSVYERRADLVTLALSAWLAAGGLLIAAQMISWWDYHFFLLLVPVALLGAKGLDTIVLRVHALAGASRARAARVAVPVALVGAFGPLLIGAGQTVAAVWDSRPLPFRAEAAAAFQAAHHQPYAAIRERTAFLRSPASHPGPIYVIDTPAYYVLAERRPALALLAPWFYPTDRLWPRLVEEVSRTDAPYIRLSVSGLETLVSYRPSGSADVARMVASIEGRYAVLTHDAEGTWFVRRDLVAGGQP